MDFIEMMLGEKLSDAELSLDVIGSDRKVLQIAYRDFTNYLKVHWNLIGKEANQCEMVKNLEKQIKENLVEFEEFLTIWTNIWLRKWKERVKLLIGNQKSVESQVFDELKSAEPYWRKIGQKQEVTELVVGALVKNGEICGTEIVAESLLKMELCAKHVQKLDDKERVLNIVNSALQKTRRIPQNNGPLIFVKIDKGYYKSE
ncbi:MAG: hypothetical protein FWF66_06615 [Candidatus Bathyarchaeota archaeon]|nr:hypothetical protein [Candidatus Termiticorpusculum sp.]MCL1971107.1 hypothetical protein [Candidatus Termiticorpusculum sp.]